MYFRQMQEFFVFFYIFLGERLKGGRRMGGGGFGVGWLKMGKPRGAGQMRASSIWWMNGLRGG